MSVEHTVRFQERPFRYTDSIEIRLALTALCNHYGTQKATAKSLGVSPQYLHDLLSGKREIGSVIASKFGLRPIRLFVPEEEPVSRDFLTPKPDRIKPTRDEITEVRRRLEYECHPGTEEWSLTLDELIDNAVRPWRRLAEKFTMASEQASTCAPGSDPSVEIGAARAKGILAHVHRETVKALTPGEGTP